jgi:hypothetical protein
MLLIAPRAPHVPCSTTALLNAVTSTRCETAPVFLPKADASYGAGGANE